MAVCRRWFGGHKFPRQKHQGFGIDDDDDDDDENMFDFLGSCGSGNPSGFAILTMKNVVTQTAIWKCRSPLSSDYSYY